MSLPPILSNESEVILTFPVSLVPKSKTISEHGKQVYEKFGSGVILRYDMYDDCVINH
jgi:hypothetical protein